MSAETSQYLPLIIGIVIAALIAVFILVRVNRRAKVISEDGAPATKDVLDEGAAPAARNQALIDAPKAVEAKFGTQSANANSDQVAAAGELADAEAGVSVAPTVGDPVPPAPSEENKAPASEGDDLTRIKGLGPKLAALLAEKGITTFAQIAAWSDEDIAKIDASLGRFAGRSTRDQWVAQAKLLESGDESGFIEKFGQT